MPLFVKDKLLTSDIELVVLDSHRERIEVVAMQRRDKFPKLAAKLV